MANNIAVSITADVTDLQVKRAIMSSELKAATADLNNLAKTARTSGMTDALKASMSAAAADVAKTRGEIVLLNAEMKKLRADNEGGSAFGGISKGLESLKGGAEQISALRASIMGVGEAVGAAFAVEGLVEWAKRMGEAGEQTEHTARILGTSVGAVQELTAEFTLMGVAPDKGILGLERLDKAFATAREGGKQQAAVFKELGVSTAQNYTQAQLLGAVMDGFKKQADGPAKVAEAMALFGRQGAALVPFLDLGTDGMAKLNQVTGQYGAVNENAVAKTALLGESFNENKVAMLGVGNVLAQEFSPAMTVAVQGVNDMVKAFVASYNAGGQAKEVMDAVTWTTKGTADVIALMGAVAIEVWDTVDGAAWMLAGVMKSIADAVIAVLKTMIDSFKTFGDVARDALTLNWGAIAGDIRSGAAQVTDDVVSAARKMGADAAKGFKQGGDDWMAGDKAVASYEAWSKKLWSGSPASATIKPTGEGQDGDTGGDATGGGHHGKSGGDSGSSNESDMQALQEKFDQEQVLHNDMIRNMQAEELAYWSGVKTNIQGGALASKDAAAVRMKVDTLTHQAAMQAIRDEIAARQDADITAIADVENAAKSKKAAIEQEIKDVEDGQKKGLISQDDATTKIKGLIEQEKQAAIDAANAILAIKTATDAFIETKTAEGTAEFKAAEKDKVEAVKQSGAAIVAATDAATAQTSDLVRKAADDQKKAWQDANREILAAEGQLVSGVISGRQTLGQMLASIAMQTATKELTADLAYWTQRRLLAMEGVAADETAEKGGFLVHLMTQNAKTVTVVSSQAAQTAATVAGNAARTAADATGATTAKAITAASAGSSIMADAGAAAAGAYKAMAGIPVVGPALGAAAAATTFGAVVAFKSMASLDAGTNYVPDDMVAQIHAGERIIPAGDNRAITDAIRDGGRNDRGAAGGGGDVHHHSYNYTIHAMDGASVRRVLEANHTDHAAAMESLVRKRNGRGFGD